MKRARINKGDMAKYPHLKKRIEQEESVVQRDTAPAPTTESKEPENKWKRFGAALGSAARGMHSGIKQYGEWVDKKNKEYEARQREEPPEPPKKKKQPPSRDRDYWPAASGGRSGSRRDRPLKVIIVRDRDYNPDNDEPIIIRSRRPAPRKQRVVYLDDDDEDDEDYQPAVVRRRKSNPETRRESHPADDIFDSDKTLEFLGYDMSPRRKR